MSVRRLAISMALLASFAGPANAQAATISVLDPCARLIDDVKTLHLTGAGFTPGSFVTFTKDGETLAGEYADDAGNVAGSFYPPVPDSFDDNLQTFQIAASDTAGVTAPAIPVTVSRIKIEAPANTKPSRRVRFKLFGMLAEKPVWLHVLRKGKVKKRVKMGRTSAPCGTLSKKMRFMPLRNYTYGKYQYWFSHSRKYSKATRYVGGTVTIYRTYG